MKNMVEERTEQKPLADECHHFWVIEVANGPTSMGECKYCGERREFHNAFPSINPLRRGRVAVTSSGADNEEEEEEFN